MQEDGFGGTGEGIIFRQRSTSACLDCGSARITPISHNIKTTCLILCWFTDTRLLGLSCGLGGLGLHGSNFFPARPKCALSGWDLGNLRAESKPRDLCHSRWAIPEIFCSVAGLISLLAGGEFCRQGVVYVVTLHWNKMLSGRGEKERLQFPDLYQIHQQGIGELLDHVYKQFTHGDCLPLIWIFLSWSLRTSRQSGLWCELSSQTTCLVNITVFAGFQKFLSEKSLVLKRRLIH